MVNDDDFLIGIARGKNFALVLQTLSRTFPLEERGLKLIFGEGTENRSAFTTTLILEMFRY